MDLSQDLPADHPLRYGTDLVLCHGTRHIRVLSLPTDCGKNELLGRWEDCFGTEDIVVWPPPQSPLLTPLPGAHHSGPSAN